MQAVDVYHLLALSSSAVKIVFALKKRIGVLFDIGSLSFGLQIGNGVAKVDGEWSSLVDGKLASGGASLLLTVEDLKAIWPRFRMLWLICCVNRQLHHIVEHNGHQLTYILIRRSKIWIGINLQQPNPKIFINEKIKPKQFPAIFLVIWVQLLSHTQKCINHNIIYPGYKMFLNINFVFFKSFGEILLKVRVAQSVALFVLGVMV